MNDLQDYSDHLDEFAAAGDFDAAFARALQTPVETPKRGPNLHGLLALAAAAAVCGVVLQDDIRALVTDWTTASETPVPLDDVDLASLDLAAETSTLREEDLSVDGWGERADDLLDAADGFGVNDPAAFDVLVQCGRAANYAGLADDCWSRASLLAEVDPLLLDLIDDADAREAITAELDRRAPYAWTVELPLGARLHLGDRVIDRDGPVRLARMVDVAIELDGVRYPCDIAPGYTALLSFDADARVRVDGGAAVACRAPTRPRPTPPPVDVAAVDLDDPEPVPLPAPRLPTEVVETKETVEEQAMRCGPIAQLEERAGAGTLSDADRACLEHYFSGSRQTAREVPSRLLLVNAHSGERADWAALASRHLRSVDADPDITYAYALHLYRSKDFPGAMRWAEMALERGASAWEGAVWTRKALMMHRVRGLSAGRLWVDAETAHVLADRDKPSRERKERARHRAKQLSREWLHFAQAAGLDDDQARSLCYSAAGTWDFCN